MWNWTTNESVFILSGRFEMGSRITVMEEFSLWFRTCLSLYLLCIRCKKCSHLMNKRSECISARASVVYCFSQSKLTNALTHTVLTPISELCGHQMLASIIHDNFSFVMHCCISVCLHHVRSWPPHSHLAGCWDALLARPWRLLQGLLSDSTPPAAWSWQWLCCCCCCCRWTVNIIVPYCANVVCYGTDDYRKLFHGSLNKETMIVTPDQIRLKTKGNQTMSYRNNQ